MNTCIINALRNAVARIPAGELWRPDVVVEQDDHAKWTWRDRNSSDRSKTTFDDEESALRDALIFADLDPEKVVQRHLGIKGRDPMNDDDWDDLDDGTAEQLAALKIIVNDLRSTLRRHEHIHQRITDMIRDGRIEPSRGPDSRDWVMRNLSSLVNPHATTAPRIVCVVEGGLLRHVYGDDIAVALGVSPYVVDIDTETADLDESDLLPLQYSGRQVYADCRPHDLEPLSDNSDMDIEAIIANAEAIRTP